MRYKILRQTLSKAYRIAIGLAFYLLDSACLLFLPTPSPRRQHVLVVRLDNIGDYLIWAGQLAFLRNKYPQGEFNLTLLGNQAWTDLAAQSMIFDRVIPLDTRRFISSLIYRIHIAGVIRRARFGTVIHPTYSRDFYRGDYIVRLSGALKRIGSSGDNCNINPFLKRIADRWYSQLVIADTAPLTEIQRNIEFMQGLGIDSEPRLANLPIDVGNLRCGLNKGEYFILFPGASRNLRRWPLERFAEIARRIKLTYGLDGVVCGTAVESPLAFAINKLVDVPLMDLCGKTTLTELVSVIGNARILVTNETGAAHIGAAVGTPTVCILGGGHFGRFLPYKDPAVQPIMRVIHYPMDCYGCNWQCRFPIASNEAAPCIDRVEVNDAWAGIMQLLDSVSE